MERFNYIDSLKGVAIILVVIGHLMSFSFGTNCLYKYIYIFHMPLFMFLSGYVMNEKQNISLLKRRLTKLLVPFLIIGISFSYYHGNDIYYFITDFFKSGYWYLYCLSVFYVFFFILHKISSLFSRKSIIMKTLSILVFILFVIIQKLYNEQLGGVLSMSMLSHLWPYYISGYFIKNEMSNRNITSNGIIYGLLVIWVLFYLIIYNIYNFDHSSLVAPIIVILLYLFFKDNAKDNRINTLLIFFGRNSLHIYVWHYFFVSSIDLHSIGYWINGSNNYIIGFCIYLFFAVIISYCCICFGKFIYQNRLLSLIFYGLNKKK